MIKIKKRISKKKQNLINSLIFFISAATTIFCLILYLWMYTEIDEALLFIEIQNATLRELNNEIYEIKSSVESLYRPDAIAKKAKDELKMVFTEPETLNVIVDFSDGVTL